MAAPVMDLIRAPFRSGKRACLSALAGFLLVPALSSALVAEEEPISKEAELEIAALRAMISEPRDTEQYELDFEPLKFDRILVRDRLGNNQVFHYLTFRLRNRVSDSADYLTKRATVYNEVLDKMVQEYEFLRKETEGGAKLVVDDVQALEDERMATILEREDLVSRPRAVSMTVVGFDQHGTRFRLFDVDPGNGPQEDFNFPDRSLVVAKNNHYQRVHEAIEERYRKRLYTTREIRDLKIPVYQAELPSTFEDGFGMSQGEVNGVIIFDRLNDLGNDFTFYINGLSNKQRYAWPEALPQGRVEDYFNLRVKRRTYVVRIGRTGDEFNLDRKPFSMRFAGWQWEERFLRLEQRKAIAYSRYFRHNIRLPEETTVEKDYATIDDEGNAIRGSTAVAVVHDEGVADEFWTHYNGVRGSWSQRYDEIIAAHRGRFDGVLGPYVVPEDTERITEEEVQRKNHEYQAWQEVLNRHQGILRDRQNALGENLPALKPPPQTDL